MIALGTQPALAGHWFARWLNGDADYRQSHIANPLAPPFQRRTWLKANPSLPYMPGLELTIRKQARKARTSDDALRRSGLSGSTVGNQQKWHSVRPERSGAGLGSRKVPERPVVLSSPLDCLGLHLLPSS